MEITQAGTYNVHVQDWNLYRLSVWKPVDKHHVLQLFENLPEVQLFEAQYTLS